MKNKISKLLAVLFVLICFAVPVFVGDMKTEAADTTSIIENYTADAASTYFKNNTAPTCKTDGYIFAGWYAEDDTVEVDETTGEEYFTGNPVATLVGYMHENVKALFVEKSVLDVKGQIAILDNEDGTADDGNLTVATVTDTTKANLRLVTSVDSLKYQNVGFEISYTYDETPVSTGSVTNYVYKNLTVVDGTDGAADEKMVPSEVFSKRSQYFKACTVNGVPKDAFDTDFSVRAYWVTADGAKVYGNDTVLNKSVQEGIYHAYEAEIDTTYYKVLEDAVATVADTDVKTVTLLKDAEVTSDMVITGNVTITNREGANVTIYRDTSLTDANMMSVSADTDAVLNIVGTTDDNSIVLNGMNVSGEPLVHNDGGILSIKNATLKNTHCTTLSGAIYAQGGSLTLESSKFIDNVGKNGGAIRTSATTTITGCVFGEEGKGNIATADGGAIYTQSKDMEVVDTQFSYNEAPRSGAVYNNAGVLVVKNSKFSNNTATGSGGGAIYQADKNADLTIIAQNDEGDKNLAIFEKNYSATTTANYGGGAICMGNGTFSITGYTFTGNYAANLGGAICIRYNYGTIEDVTFNNNYTTGANGYGGAVCILYNSKSSIIDSTFIENYTEGSGAHGGAVYLAAKAATTTVTNPTYTDNKVKVDDAHGADIYIAE